MDSQSAENNTTGFVVGHHHHHQSHPPSPPPTESLPPPPLPPYYGAFQGSEEKNRTGIVVGHHHNQHQSYNPPPPTGAMDSQSEEKNSTGTVIGHHHQSETLPQVPPYYGTFQGIPNYSPAIGFPQPGSSPSSSDPRYYAYQSVPGYGCAVDEEGGPIRERRPMCCGIGLGWWLFVLGFFLAGIPWYTGAVLLICSRRSLDYREKPGYILCAIAAVLVTIAIVLGMAQGDDYDW